MAGNRQAYESLASMPRALQDFLSSAEFGKADIQLQKSHALSDEQMTGVGDAMMDAIFGDIALQDAVASMKAKLVPAVVAADTWKVFLTDLLRLEAWPLRDVFGEELTHILSEEGIGTAGWPVYRVLIRPLTYSGAATEVATQAGFNFLGPQMRERMRELVISKIKGVRIDSQVKEVLLRPTDFGGLGLDKATADRAVAALSDIVAKVPIMSEDEYADHLSEEMSKKTEVEEKAAKPKGPASADEIEIEEVRLKMGGTPRAAPTLLEDAVSKIWDSLQNTLTDEYLVKRLRNAINSRLRDVRSQLDLVQLLQRDSKVGGMGMERGAAERMAQKIEEGYQSFRGPILEEEKGKIAVQMEDQKKKIEERRKLEAEEHAKWFQEKIGAKREEENRQKQFAESFRKQLSGASAAAGVGQAPMDAKEQKRETERFGEMVPAVSAGATPIMTATQMGVRALPPGPPSPATPAQFMPAPPSAQARPEVKVSMPTAHIQSQARERAPTTLGTAGLKPKMEDIRSSPRLVGLTQEIRELTLSEFRRLAKRPEDAAQKIMQKLETLGGEAFEKRLAGVQAWQQSPLQQTYLALVTESFRSGKPVNQLSEDKRRAGIDVPSPDELAAIISLNGKLHF